MDSNNKMSIVESLTQESDNCLPVVSRDKRNKEEADKPKNPCVF